MNPRPISTLIMNNSPHIPIKRMRCLMLLICCPKNENAASENPIGNKWMVDICAEADASMSGNKDTYI